MTRVLAFMCSRHRPLMLRHAILQMMVQSYPVDLVIYINSDEINENDYTTNYQDLISDLIDTADQKIRAKFGQSSHQHLNYLQALSLANLEDYDLFLKIDDDDVYRRSYVEDIVKSYEKNHWDLSGEHSVGTINGLYWKPRHTLKNMGSEPHQICCGMAASWAFSRAAIKTIANLEYNPSWFEDRLWKHHLESSPDFKLHCRGDAPKNYRYNVHGENTSSSTWLEKRDPQDSPQTLTSFQAVRMSVNLIKQALPLLPGDLYRKLVRRLRPKQ